MRQPIAIAVIALLATTVPAGAPRAQDAGRYVGNYGSWEARAYTVDGSETRCAIRALHPAILEGEVFWIFNTRHAKALPDGYLAVDRRLAASAASVALVVDGEKSFELRTAEDGFAYNLAADAAELMRWLRRGIEMDVVLADNTGGRLVLPVSLIGFTRGSDAARAICFGR